MSLILKSSRFRLLNLFTGLFACAHYFYYSSISDSFNLHNLVFIFATTNFTYEFLQIKKINYFFLSISILSLIFFKVDNILGLALAGLITIAYEFKFREIIWLKPISIAISWSLLFKFQQEHMSIFLESFIFILALSIPFDIRDYSEDKKQNFTTIVTRLGLVKSKFLCSFIWITYLVTKPLNHSLDTRDLIVLSFMSLMYFILLKKISPKISRFYTYIYLDSIILIQIFLVLLK